ncbi:MAG TPA: peptidase M28 family protein, partial [Sphingomicrobium sp.]
MLRSMIAASLLAAAAPLAAQVHHSPQVDPKVAALRDKALADNYAWDITEGLTTEIGPRLAGTEAEARARDWAVRKLTAMGFANVRVETFDMPTWVRGHE